MDLKETVKQKYSEAALRVFEGGSPCCGPKVPTGIAQTARMSHEIYEASEISGIPADAIVASLGCGNPTKRTCSTETAPPDGAIDLGLGRVVGTRRTIGSCDQLRLASRPARYMVST